MPTSRPTAIKAAAERSEFHGFSDASCRLHLTKSRAKGPPHASHDPRAAPAPALAPVLHARPGAGCRRRLERFWFYAASKSVCARTHGARRKRRPAGSMIAAVARSRAFRSAWKCSARMPASPWSRRPRARSAVHGAARPNSGGGADLQSETLIAEFKAPATIADPGHAVADGELEDRPRSVVGLPAVPQRGSLVFEEPAIDRISASTRRHWTRRPCRVAWKAGRGIHGRITP